MNQHRNDLEYQWLLDKGVAPAQLNDMWFAFLRSLGYTGALDDMKKAWWESGAPDSGPGWTIGNAGFLYGYRPPDHPTNSFGALVPPRVASGQRVWQLTVNSSNNVVVLQLENDEQWGTFTNILIEINGGADFTTVFWSASNNRYETTDPAFAPDVVAAVGTTVDFAFTPLVVIDPPPVQIGNPHNMIAGQNGAGTRVGYRRGSWGSYLPADIPELRRFFSRSDIDRVVLEIDGDWTVATFIELKITRVLTGVTETFGPPNLELYNGTLTRWRWDIGYKFVDGEEYVIRVLQ